MSRKNVSAPDNMSAWKATGAGVHHADEVFPAMTQLVPRRTNGTKIFFESGRWPRTETRHNARNPCDNQAIMPDGLR